MGYTLVTRLVVTGMTSPAAARQAEAALAGLGGVDLVRTDLAAHLVTVRHGESVTSTELITALEKAGFPARHALPGEGAPAYATSPWGVLRAAGRTPVQEAAVCRFLSVAGLALIGSLLALPVFVAREDHVRLLGFVLASVAQAMLGAQFYAGAAQELAGRRPGSDFLMALASTAAYVYGVAVAFGALQPYQEFTPGSALRTFGIPTVILTAVIAGRCVELWLTHRASAAFRALIQLAPPTARVVRGAEERTVLACDLVAGDLVVVGPGERFPADGPVAEGHSAVDESVLTGEALPVPKGPGDGVLGGTLNGNGRLAFRAERVCSETILAQVVRRLSDAARREPAATRAAGRAARVIVLGASLAAAAAFVSSYYHSVGAGMKADRSVESAMLRAVAILVVACPWALLAAVSGAYAGAVARAAREGIIFRSGTVLEECARLRAVVFLRSGNLTLGRPELSRLIPAAGAADPEVLGLAAGIAGAAGHPMARGLAEAARARGVPEREVAEAAYLPGLGVQGRLPGGERLLFGRRVYLAQEGVDVGELAAPAEELEAAGLTVRFLAMGGKPLALLAFADPVRPGAAQVVESLSRMGLATYVLSSEASGTVRALAAQTGIPPENICAGVRPAERAARLRAIREQAGATVAVGHGIKDAELLSSADVGVAIGGGAEVAVDCTAVALIGGDLHGVRRVLRLARGMVRTARINLAASVVFALAGLPLAALLVPDRLSPIQVTLVMVLVALAVALNSYRLARSSSEKD